MYTYGRYLLTASPFFKHKHTPLQGHIALATVVFPEGTLGSRLDCLARQSLWQAGLDYNHGEKYTRSTWRVTVCYLIRYPLHSYWSYHENLVSSHVPYLLYYRTSIYISPMIKICCDNVLSTTMYTPCLGRLPPLPPITYHDPFIPSYPLHSLWTYDP